MFVSGLSGKGYKLIYKFKN